MTHDTRAGRPKIEAAKEAAQLFLQRMSFPDDQAAVVAFNEQAYLLQTLTPDRHAVLAALDAVENHEFTRIDLGLRMARDQLVGPGHIEANTPAVILLTDGKSNPVPVSEALDAADAAKRDGIVLFTIGLGEQVEADALRAMASRPEFYRFAPDGEDLGPIYEKIAGQIPCPPSAFWPFLP